MPICKKCLKVIGYGEAIDQLEQCGDCYYNVKPKHSCGETLMENTYHGAVKKGAKWFCFKCDAHLTGDLKEIKA